MDERPLEDRHLSSATCQRLHDVEDELVEELLLELAPVLREVLRRHGVHPEDGSGPA